MLIRTKYKCEKCGAEKNDIVQSISFTCVKCGATYRMCQECGHNTRCPKCGGSLESSMDWAAKNGIIF